MGSMSDSPEEKRSERDVDHGFGDVEALLIVSHEASPSGHPAEGSLDHPTSGEDVETFLAFDAPYDLDDEVEKLGLVHEFSPIVGAVGEQMLDPWPALCEPVEDHLSAGAVGNIRRCEIDHQKTAVRIDGDVALAPDDLLGGVKAPFPGARRFHRLAVDDACRGTGFMPRFLAIHHHRNIMDGVEQQPPDKLAEPPVNRLPWWKVRRQHLPAAAGANQIADRIDDLAKIGRARTASLRGLWEQRRDDLPFLVGQVCRVALELLSDLGHPATRFNCPHDELESRNVTRFKPFSKSLSAVRRRF